MRNARLAYRAQLPSKHKVVKHVGIRENGIQGDKRGLKDNTEKGKIANKIKLQQKSVQYYINIQMKIKFADINQYK